VIARDVVPVLGGYVLAVTVIVWGARHPEARPDRDEVPPRQLGAFVRYVAGSLVAAYALLLAAISAYSFLIARDGADAVESIAWSAPFLGAVALAAFVSQALLSSRRR
jgi:hypothetical protein